MDEPIAVEESGAAKEQQENTEGATTQDQGGSYEPGAGAGAGGIESLPAPQADEGEEEPAKTAGEDEDQEAVQEPEPEISKVDETLEKTPPAENSSGKKKKSKNLVQLKEVLLDGKDLDLEENVSVASHHTLRWLLNYDQDIPYHIFGPL